MQVCAHFTDLLGRHRRRFVSRRAERAFARVRRRAGSRNRRRRPQRLWPPRDGALFRHRRDAAARGQQSRALWRPSCGDFRRTCTTPASTSASPPARLREACGLAISDATVLTSLSESRLIVGDQPLFDHFERRFRRMTRRRWRRLLAAAEEARREERSKYGETVFLLEPNVKRSRGGLRELQFIRWIGFIRYGESDFDALAEAGWLTKEEQLKLRAAHDFLLWVRNDLHFQHGKAEDVLDRTEQLRIAALRNYPEIAGLLPVEQFMREYFQHTSDVREIAAHLAEVARPRSLWWWLVEPLVSHQFEGDFRVGPLAVSATRPRPGQGSRRSGRSAAAARSGQSARQAHRPRHLAGHSLRHDEPRPGRSRSAVAARGQRAIHVAAFAAAAAGRARCGGCTTCGCWSSSFRA